MARRRKRYRPKPVHIPMALKAHQVLHPVEAAIQQILDTGYTDTIDGTPVILHKAIRTYFDLPGTLLSIAKLSDLISDGSVALRRLSRKLAYSMPLMEADLAGSLAEIKSLYPALTAMTPEQAHAAVLQSFEETT